MHKRANRRYEIHGHCRYLTFSCRHRLPLFKNNDIKDTFVSHLARSREHAGFRLISWVVMPEHVHLLILPDVHAGGVNRMLSTLKRPFAEQVLRRWRELDAPVLKRLSDRTGRTRFWQPGGGYDRNIYSIEELVEKINYIHANPVRRGLVGTPTEWRWSSARWYAGDHDDPVSIDRVWGM